MVSVSVGEAKNRLTQLLHLVDEGQEVQVTRHGKVVAYINGESPVADRRAAFLQGIQSWRKTYGDLFEEEEIEKIFKPDFIQNEDGVRHQEDFL